MRLLVRSTVIAAFAGVAVVASPLPAARGDGCGSLPAPVGCGASADPANGYFHGVIGVAGQDWVLDLSSRSGTTSGCGDCTWTVVFECEQSSPDDPGSMQGCAGMSAGNLCPPDQTPYRLYLSTSAVTYQLVGTICLGGSAHIVEVGADAESDVERYLDNVRPPDLIITKRPRGATLTGLPAYFSATIPPGALGPETFGGPSVSETITLAPRQVNWWWGDGNESGWLSIDAVASHRYLAPGNIPGTLSTRWSATYTATFDGHTVGPFDATGTLERNQPFTEPVTTSSPVLVAP